MWSATVLSILSRRYSSSTWDRLNTGESARKDSFAAVDTSQQSKICGEAHQSREVYVHPPASALLIARAPYHASSFSRVRRSVIGILARSSSHFPSSNSSAAPGHSALTCTNSSADSESPSLMNVFACAERIVVIHFFALACITSSESYMDFAVLANTVSSALYTHALMHKVLLKIANSECRCAYILRAKCRIRLTERLA